ncbi:MULTISPECIES: hypothetical protein [unclassified Fusobacterium]|uniref:hypothetical protein n=1 Tax=unclassified Fusobacterium TaxID=2648384 RepID=UPI001B8AC2F6|nr:MULTISPECIES: hypothetical protein [unclassified Fusobacterium]MBR8700821.1 hypothetical protein [Fusobacterium sp. DD45]MBR8710640.1 hypothetical protein [Fusobacterium sp. DD28]MBR8751171.1 hypothetical protein [Fusobacterium sp. DD26]
MKVMLKKIFNRKVAFLAAALLVLESGITSLYAENWVNVNGTAPDNLEDSNYDKSHSGAIGKSSIAVGNKAIAEGDSSVAVGINVHNIGKTIKNNYGSYGATAIGMNNVNNGYGSTTIGYGETTIGNYNTAVGAMNDTAGQYNNVYGSRNDVKKK